MFVAEKYGDVRVVSAAGVLQPTPLLDISAHVYDVADRGLLGIATDSDFASNHWLYLLYVYNPTPEPVGLPRTSRLTRVTVNDDNTASTETVILGHVSTPPCPTPSNTVDCIPSDYDSHAIGTVRSDTDGTLWLGNGDSRDWSKVDPVAVRTYNEQSFSGKIIHVDRNGMGLPGHAFCPTDNDLTHVCTKLYAKGLRNPFRFTLRPGTGPVVGDVGWEQWEEIDLMTAPGRNYGWPCHEANTNTPGYSDLSDCVDEYARERTAGPDTLPDYAYPHDETNAYQAAIVGGPVYPAGGPYPADFAGNIFFADYVSGYIKRLELDGQGRVTGATGFATGVPAVDLELGPEGDLYYADFGDGGPGTGSVKRVVYTPGNRTPVAKATATPTFGSPPLSVEFSGAGSSDPDGDPLTYEWDFGDGTAHDTQRDPTHVYGAAGEYDARITVRDDRGASATAIAHVSVGNSPPTATIQAPATGSEFFVGQRVDLRGSATDPEEGNLTGAALSWHVVLLHITHVHDLGTFAGGSTGFTADPNHDADAHYRITLTATDAHGLTDSKAVEIYPKAIDLTLNSSPPGAPVTYAGGTVPAPTTRRAAIGFHASISAAQSFTVGGIAYEFAGWSDGGARAHEIVIPAAPTTLTAIYATVGAAGPLTPSSASVTAPLKDAMPPVLKLRAGKVQRALKQKGVVIKVESNEADTVTASGSVTVPVAGRSRAAKRYKLKPVSKALRAGQTKKLELKFGAKPMKAIAAALHRRKLKARVRVTAVDGAGNKSARSLEITLER